MDSLLTKRLDNGVVDKQAGKKRTKPNKTTTSTTRRLYFMVLFLFIIIEGSFQIISTYSAENEWSCKWNGFRY